MAVFVAYGANYLIPRSGDVLRAAVATNYEKVPFEKSFGTVVAERLADMAVLFTIIGVTLIVEFDFIWNLLTAKLNPVSMLVALFAILLIGGGIIYFLYKSELKLAIKIKKFLKGLVKEVTLFT